MIKNAINTLKVLKFKISILENQTRKLKYNFQDVLEVKQKWHKDEIKKEGKRKQKQRKVNNKYEVL